MKTEFMTLWGGILEDNGLEDFVFIFYSFLDNTNIKITNNTTNKIKTTSHYNERKFLTDLVVG